MKKYSLLFVLAIFASCKFFHKPHSPYKGFSTDDGITFCKYCDLGAIRKPARIGDVTEAVISYATIKDSVFWSSRNKGYPYFVFIPYTQLASGSTYEHALLKANAGDSLVYIVPADSVFTHILHMPLPYFLHTGDMMKVYVRVNAIMGSQQYTNTMKKIIEYRKDLDMQEQLNLLRYVSGHNIPDSLKHSHMYIIPLALGTGPEVKQGDMVSMAYKGSFLNGKVFDSVPLNAPLQFRYGDTAQIIEGLELALKYMREGGKAKIIIPSQLAFGNNGSSTGIVPPYTSVVYEVTLLKVKAL